MQRRFAQGFNLNVGYTRMRSVTADYFANEFDADPSWRESNDARPPRFVATGIYQFPFGKGHPFARSGPLSYLLGGFQVAATFEWSPGPLLNFGNLFYYGDSNQDVMNGITDPTLKEAFSIGDPSILEKTNFTPNLTADQRDAWTKMWAEVKAAP